MSSTHLPPHALLPTKGFLALVQLCPSATLHLILFDGTKQCGGSKRSFELRSLGLSPNPIINSLYDLHQSSSPISICLTRGLGHLRFLKGHFMDH